MTDRELLYVKTIAEEQNITKAAEKLHIAQPSLTQCLQRIEKNLGCSLFRRKKYGMELTKTGILYYQAACKTLEIWDNFLREITGISDSKRKHFVIGASWYNTTFVLIPVLSQYKEENPLADISLVEKNTDDLEQLLSKGKVNLILGHQYPNGYPDFTKKHDSSLKKIPLFNENFLIVSHKSFGLRNFSIPEKNKHFQKLPLIAISSIPFIRFSEQQRIRKISDFILASGKINPPTVLSTYGFPSALEFVNQKMGITFLPENYIKSNLLNYENLEFFKIGDSPYAYWTTIAEYYPSDHLSFLREPLLNLLKKQGGT